MVRLKLKNNKEYVLKEFSFLIFHIVLGYIGIKKVSININIKWGW